MIVNPVVHGGEKLYHIEADLSAQRTGFPASGNAKAGEYIVSTSGEVFGAQALLTGDKNYEILESIMYVSSVDELPPLAREKLEGIPIVKAPPPAKGGYAFFVMPGEDVYVQTY
jgi:hypothetical protein